MSKNYIVFSDIDETLIRFKSMITFMDYFLYKTPYASRPEADQKRKEFQAINEAKQGNAGLTAPVELQTAEDKLTAARAAAAKGDYDEAMRQADQAHVDADYARARAGNARMKALADEMRQNIQTLRQELNRLPR